MSSQGLLLDPVSGHPQRDLSRTVLSERGVPFAFEENMRRGWQAYMGRGIPETIFERIPDNVVDLLEKAAMHRPQPGQQELVREPQMAGNFYGAPLYWIIADGTQVLNTTTEAILVPAFTLPAGFMVPGSTLRYTVYFSLSTVATTPGTITQRLRYNGTGGTALATSGAFAGTTTVKTTLSCRTTYLLTCRTIGTAGTVMVVGDTLLPNIDPTSAATIAANLAMFPIPVSAPATVAINTTTANTLDPTIQFSVSTATTQATAVLAVLESLV